MLALLALAVVGLSACTPTPEPTPTAAFASEEEAFAAAEETYRAYNDAGNARRSGESTPDPQDFLIGGALEGDIDALNQLRDADLHLEGVVEVTSFSSITVDLESHPERVIALVCLDTSGTHIVNGSGEDITPAERETKVAQQVTLIAVEDSLRVSAEDSAEDSKC